MNILPHLKYLRTVLRHKFWVFVYGYRLGVPIWRLLIHDLSKFGRQEWPAYVARFASGRAGKESKQGDTGAFGRAWKHHWKTNPHHWEHWVNPCPSCEGHPVRMPDTYVREMVADWKAASKVYSGKDNCWEWYEKTRDRQVMHPSTRREVERMLRSDGLLRKRDKMAKTGEKICMVLDCDGELSTHPDMHFMYVCRDCGVVQRKENVMFLRVCDRDSATGWPSDDR